MRELGIHAMGRLTGVLGLGDNLAEQLDVVREVVAEEACLENESFTGVVRSQLATEQL